MKKLKIINEEEYTPLLISKIDGIDNPVQLHFHQNYEISYIIRGGGQYIINNNIYNIEDHDLFLIDKNVAHTASSKPGTSMLRYSLKFLKGVVKPFNDKTDLLEVFTKSQRAPFNKIPIPLGSRKWFKDTMESMLDKSRFAWDVRQKILLCELLIAINELSMQSSLSNTHLVVDTAIQNLIQYIDTNLDQNLTLDKLAGVASISKYHLTRKFKTTFGVSIHQYIITLRIGQAVKMLEQDVPINEICDLTGFGTYSNFIATFKRMKGLPPLQYKKKMLEYVKSNLT